MNSRDPYFQKPIYCPSCSTPLHGRYCHNCGEKVLEREEMTMKHFFGNVWNAITFSDLKFLRSIWYLLVRPGLLTSEYFAGRRKIYASPIGLFFFINLLYFLYQPVDAINSSLNSQINGQVYSSWAKEIVRERVVNYDLDIQLFNQAYNQMSSQLSKLFLVVVILFHAIGVALVNFRRRKLFFFHVITATHYVSFAILSLFVIAPFLGSIGMRVYVWLANPGGIDFNPNAWYVTIPGLLLLLTYATGM